MRIAFITPLYFPSVGGTQAWLDLLGKYLVSQGHEVRVYTSQRSRMEEPRIGHWRAIKHFPSDEIKNGVQIRRFPCGGWLEMLLGVARSAAGKLHLPFRGVFKDLYELRLTRSTRMLKALKDFKPDAILLKPYNASRLKLLLAAGRATGASIFVHTALHVDAPHSDLSRSELALLGDCDGVFTNTEYERTFLTGCGVNAGNIHVTGVGIDTEVSATAHGEENPLTEKLMRDLSGKKYVLYLGRKQEGKGIEALIAAMEKVRVRFPEARLVLAGESTEFFERHILPLTAGKGYIDNVGRVEGALKHRLFENAFIFAMVSRVDSFGLVYLEAWRFKKAVIGADLGAMRCLIKEGDDGFLVPYGDADRLAVKIGECFENPALADGLGESGFAKLMGNYTAQKVAEKIEGLLKRTRHKA